MSVLDPSANAKATARLLLAELVAQGQESDSRVNGADHPTL
jgi:hypothetical protein